MRLSLVCCAGLIGLLGCLRPLSAQDPAHGLVPLPAQGGWQASLVYDGGYGIWTVRCLQLLPRYGCPEIIGLDDKGRCTVLVSYSGKWTPFQTVVDGQWLGALAHVDLDPLIPGPELYTVGKRGNLYRILPRKRGGFNTAIVARFAGREIHTLVAGDLDPARPGSEMLAFTRDGAVFEIRPTAKRPAACALERIGTLPGRVRDAVLLAPRPGESPRIMAVLRAGEVACLRLTSKGLVYRTVLREPMGFGRMARRPSHPGSPETIYVTRDDGVILRLSEGKKDTWRREMIYAGPQGARGVVAGRFTEDPQVESVAVFGYSHKVQLLSRHPGGPWRVETIFHDRDKGHWLEVAELDGRNATREIIGSGYGSRIFLLSRPPGYGLKKVPTGRQAEENPVAKLAQRRPPRVAVRAGQAALTALTPLSYQGGFETKTLVYETLVRRDREGRIVPGLAASWQILEGGRRVVFTLREGARWHDGRPVGAKDVATAFRRWVGLPEHAWIGASRRIHGVRALSEHKLEVTLDGPYALLPDLCALNPCAVEGPGSRDSRGGFLHPVGSGPFAWVGPREEGRVLRYRQVSCPSHMVDLVRIKEAGDDGLQLLLRGDLDVLAESWLLHIPRRLLARLARDPAFRILECPGSSVVYLSFALRGATAKPGLRRRVAEALSRTEIVRRVERGYGDPCTAWAAPAVRIWPCPPREQGLLPADLALATRHGPGSLPESVESLVITAKSRQLQTVARVVAQELARAGIKARVVAPGGKKSKARSLPDAWDLKIERTWGLPYDPWLSLSARFLAAAQGDSMQGEGPLGVDPGLARLVAEAATKPDLASRRKVYQEIQELMDAKTLIVPLYVPRRVMVLRANRPAPHLDADLYQLDLGCLWP